MWLFSTFAVILSKNKRKRVNFCDILSRFLNINSSKISRFISLLKSLS